MQIWFRQRAPITVCTASKEKKRAKRKRARGVAHSTTSQRFVVKWCASGRPAQLVIFTARPVYNKFLNNTSEWILAACVWASERASALSVAHLRFSTREMTSKWWEWERASGAQSGRGSFSNFILSHTEWDTYLALCSCSLAIRNRID